MNRLAALGCIAVTLVFPCPLSAQIPADYLTMSGTGGPGAYTLTANYVTNHPASHAPSGNVTFQDTTYSNATVASAPFASTGTISGLSEVSLPSIASGNLTLYGAAAKDFDGDGKLDVLLSDSSEHLNFVKGNGDGSFQTAQVEQSITTDSFIVADVNDDAKLDLIAANNTAGTTSLRLGNGDGTFQAPVLLFAGTSVLS